MIRKIWKFLGSLELAFWLIMITSAVLFTGTLCTGANYSFFQTLNSTRIQDWLIQNFNGNILITLWLPALFIVMGLLGVNVFVCACQRISSLLPMREKIKPVKWLILLIPSLIHLLFIAVLIGHLLTFAGGRWERIPIEEGRTLTADGLPSMRVSSIEKEFFPSDSGFGNRISQVYVSLTDSSGEKIRLSFLNPVLLKGKHLHLDMKKKRMKALIKEPEKEPDSTDEENCNEAPAYHVKKTQPEPKLQLLIVSDPGLYLILFSFTLILILMVIYFGSITNKKMNL